MKVTWTPEAEADRLELTEYIAVDNPRAASRVDELFEAAAKRLAEFPLLGRVGIIPGTRELIPHSSYRMVYEVRDDGVWITSVAHTARQWPPISDESD
ncbi:type II toxin-antitoxin system RelE/ParE family toxin [Mesorhizobium sp. LHD-90]|uniref:type II toxin-antitoxin system RelE/ParE family toxin n=1 Tax=Mesorhizobium sp. LHD-90 TaxID=3071414 RepID=UPI0027E178D9|nr:type II toxin-antitoxin system RelE/ParE family toxin [Mesorhizobium sp. LHD-90]MDQ6435851.1 type II toxin-antitoxin system RelE/ParE family toxin [Mesorhizobium sp. LHD-90]